MSVAEIEARELELERVRGRALARRAFTASSATPARSSALVLVAVLTFVAIFAPWLAPYDPIEQNLDAISQGPSREHLLGTDEIGRDELSRLIYGARYSLLIGVVAVAVGLSVGLLLGAIAGLLPPARRA